MQKLIFEYGGKHFVPVRKFEKKDGDFYQITRRLRTDREFGFFRADYYGKDSQKADYNHEEFFAASTDKTCDIFQCMENGKLYALTLGAQQGRQTIDAEIILAATGNQSLT